MALLAVRQDFITSPGARRPAPFGLVFIALSAAATACESPRSEFGSASRSDPSLPAAAGANQVEDGIVVRPDRVALHFTVSAEGGGAEHAVASVQSRVGEVHRLLQQVAPLIAVRLRNSRLTAGRCGYGGSKGKSDHSLCASTDGTFELPLDPATDFWARTRIVSAIVATASRASQDRQAATAVFQSPAFEASDAEAHRAKLIERWLTRTRGFANAVQSPATPLQITGCIPPGPVIQRTLSMDEVELTLPLACTLGAGAPPRPPATK